MTPDEAIAIVNCKANGRTRYEGQEPYLDEVLAAEIIRLQKLLNERDAFIVNNDLWHKFTSEL